MNMATNIEYALMAGAAYISSRPDANAFPAPGLLGCPCSAKSF